MREERSRDDGRDRGDECLRRRAAELRAREQQDPRRHAFREHRDVTQRQLDRRVTQGINARGIREVRPTQDATRWRSDEALVRTADAIWDSPAGRAARAKEEDKFRRGLLRERTDMRVQVSIPLETALGPDWRRSVEGRSLAANGRSRPTVFSVDARGFAYWQMGADNKWRLITCFPKP
jgi:hypothetical protein